MKKNEILKATDEEIEKRMLELIQEGDRYSFYIDAYYNSDTDLVEYEDFLMYKKLIRDNDREMNLIEKLRPDVVQNMFK